MAATVPTVVLPVVAVVTVPATRAVEVSSARAVGALPPVVVEEPTAMSPPRAVARLRLLKLLASLLDVLSHADELFRHCINPILISFPLCFVPCF
jgi:hypothetical protein